VNGVTLCSGTDIYFKMTNSEISIVEVTTKKQIKEFYQFQNRLYKDCPQYVPSLDLDQKATVTKDPALEYCTTCKWLAYKDGKVAGRIMAIVNPRYNNFYGTTKGRFGWYDFIEDYDVAKALMDKAKEWFKAQGMNYVHGPLAYNTTGRQGMLIEGFENIPPFNCLYNYPYYVDFMQRMGFEKEVDWVQYQVPVPDLKEGVPERFVKLGALLQKRYNLKILDFKHLSKGELPKFIRSFFNAYNEVFKAVPNFIPLNDEEIMKEGTLYFKLLKSELACIIVDSDNEVAAYGICMPSMSKALQKCKGNLFPFGWFHLLKAYIKYDTVDMMLLGSSPKWEGKGLSAIYHTYLCGTFIRRRCIASICNPQIETNNALKVWESYPHSDYMRRRCWKMEL